MFYKSICGIFSVVLCLFHVTQCTHFRGSMISWRVINASTTPLIVEIFQRHAWRYTYFTPLCTSATIPISQPILGSTGSNIVCVSTCPTGLTTLGSVQVPCTGYNIGEQYAMGEGRFNVPVPRNSSFVASFSASAWFNLVTGNNLPWSVAVQIQTFKRSDNGQYNHAPIVTMLPIYRLRNSISYSLKINVADNDFDPYICLWSQGSTQCGGLNNSVPGGIVDNYNCYLNYTPNIDGYYAAALTVEDFIIKPISIAATNYLSQVPIQFVFHVYSDPNPCYIGPIYIGDLVPDICIFMSVSDTYTTRVRFQVQCANATVNSTISVNPTGLLTTALQQDPFEPTIFAFLATYTASASQEGQNLFCFAGVDSIGNQGDSACLRFTVVSQTSSLQPLYTLNTTRYPMGTVSKTTSLWTIFTGPTTYTRPITETYIRFKTVLQNSDYYVLNVVTATDRVLYYSDRIVINSSVEWTPGVSFYIYFDPGVLVPASTCTKAAMPINDPTFWPFNIPSETTTTIATTTTTTSVSTLSTERTTPTRQTLATLTTITTTSTTSISTTITSITTASTTTFSTTYQLPTSATIGIVLGCLFIGAPLIWVIFSFIHVTVIYSLLLKSGLQQQLLGIHCTPSLDLQHNQTENNNFPSVRQYKLVTRYLQKRTAGKYAIVNNKTSLQRNLVEPPM